MWCVSFQNSSRRVFHSLKSPHTLLNSRNTVKRVFHFCSNQLADHPSGLLPLFYNSSSSATVAGKQVLIRIIAKLLVKEMHLEIGSLWEREQEREMRRGQLCNYGCVTDWGRGWPVAYLPSLISE